MTSSFNETAWQLLGAVSGVEMRALYNVAQANSSNPNLGLTSWGPTINILRDIRWGRTQEASSESALVSGRYGAAISRGLQAGADPRYLLAVAGLKHFAAYRCVYQRGHRQRQGTRGHSTHMPAPLTFSTAASLAQR